MKRDSLFWDLAIAVAVLLGIAVTFYLVSVGIGLLMVIGFIVPGWLILILFAYMMYKKKEKAD
jgi:energy-coupling factor transporter transmembrane protein EcfT